MIVLTIVIVSYNLAKKEGENSATFEYVVYKIDPKEDELF